VKKKGEGGSEGQRYIKNNSVRQKETKRETPREWERDDDQGDSERRREIKTRARRKKIDAQELVRTHKNFLQAHMNPTRHRRLFLSFCLPCRYLSITDTDTVADTDRHTDRHTQDTRVNGGEET